MKAESMQYWKPNKWVAATISFFVPPLGMLYVNRAGAAGLYLLALLGVVAAWFSEDLITYIGLLAFCVSLVAAVHTYLIAAGALPLGDRPWYSRWYGLCWALLAYAVVALSVRSFLYEPFSVPSVSMEPSFRKGSYVLADKFGFGHYSTFGITLLRTELTAKLVHGEVVVFELPDKDNILYLQRIVGLPGDHIEYSNKRLTVNGKTLTADVPLSSEVDGSREARKIYQEADYRVGITATMPVKDFALTVEPEHVFLMGDNRDNSYDGRYLGQTRFDHLYGKIVTAINPKNGQK